MGKLAWMWDFRTFVHCMIDTPGNCSGCSPYQTGCEIMWRLDFIHQKARMLTLRQGWTLTSVAAIDEWMRWCGDYFDTGDGLHRLTPHPALINLEICAGWRWCGSCTVDDTCIEVGWLGSVTLAREIKTKMKAAAIQQHLITRYS